MLGVYADDSLATAGPDELEPLVAGAAGRVASKSEKQARTRSGRPVVGSRETHEFSMEASSAALAGLETPFQTDLSACESGVAHGVTPAELGGIEHLKNDRVPHALHHRYSFMCSRPVSSGWDVTYTDNQKEERENRLSFSDH